MNRLALAALAACLSLTTLPAAAGSYDTWWQHTTPHYSSQYFGNGWYGRGYSSHGMSRYTIMGPHGRTTYCTSGPSGVHCN